MKALKLRAFEALTGNPEIPGSELAKRLGVTPQTAYRYKVEFKAMIEETNRKIAERIADSTENGGGIWLVINKWLKARLGIR